MPRRRPRQRTRRPLRTAPSGVAVALTLGLLPVGAAVAGASASASKLPPVSDLQQYLQIPGGAAKLPAACNLSWPTKAWPPRIDTEAKAHALRPSDVPAGLRQHPPTFATNAPDLDELAVGFPHTGFAEVFFSKGSGPGPGSTVDERVGRAATTAAATTLYRADRDELFGSCQQYFPGLPLPRYPLSGGVAADAANVFAYREANDTRGASFSSIVVVGHRGRYVFDVSIGTYGYDPSTTPTTVAPPSPTQVSAVLDAALARLGH